MSGGIGQEGQMQKAAHSIHDPKHKAGFTNETNDCAVRAMANAFGISYPRAHAAMKVAGRQDRKGTAVGVIDKVVTQEHNGKRAVRLNHIGTGKDQRQVSIGTFCKYRTTGSYYCIVRGHAFAIVDGVVQDAFKNKAGKRIYRAYEIV